VKNANSQLLPLSRVLEEHPVIGSAPCRVDASGTWDLKALALPYQRIRPSTANIALNMRTFATLGAFTPGWVMVRNDETYEAFPVSEVPLDSRFGLVFAAVSHAAVEGLSISLSHESPRYAGLGGSGTLMVAVLGALGAAASLAGGKSFDFVGDAERTEVVALAHHLEDGLHFSNTGMQDQAAAAFGGAHQWEWRYADAPPFVRRSLIRPGDELELEGKMAIAYVGASHDSSDVNTAQMRDFFSGRTRAEWLEINELGRVFADSIEHHDYQTAANALQREHEIRCALVPRRNTPVGKILEQIARQHGCGFAVSGAGNGGCVWALGEDEEDVRRLRDAWAEALKDVPTGKVLSSEIATDGLLVTLG
jgi:D-glycero-alpha-D-manno-heptose-7-phosphate kinase